MAARKRRKPGRTPVLVEFPDEILARIKTITDAIHAAEPHGRRNRHAAILRLVSAGLEVLEVSFARPRLKRVAGSR